MDSTQIQAECPSCKAEVSGRFCSQCGQDLRPVARRWRTYAEEGLYHLLDMDSSILRTYGSLIRRPGALARRKVENRDRGLVTPIKLFFVTMVFYGLFFGLSPVQYGQVRFGTELELWEEGPQTGWDWEFLYFTPKIEPAQMILPQLRGQIETGRTEDIPEGRLEHLTVLAEDPVEAERLQQGFSSLVPYTVLSLGLPVMAFGMIFFRRRYVIEHVFVALEATTQYLLLTVITGVGVFALRSAGLQIGEFMPFLFFTMPVYLVWLMVTLGAFYDLKLVSRFAAAFAIVFVYLAIDEFVKLALVNFALAGVPTG